MESASPVDSVKSYTVGVAGTSVNVSEAMTVVPCTRSTWQELEAAPPPVESTTETLWSALERGSSPAVSRDSKTAAEGLLGVVRYVASSRTASPIRADIATPVPTEGTAVYPSTAMSDVGRRVWVVDFGARPMV